MSAQAFFEDLRARIPSKAHERATELAGSTVMFRSTKEPLLRAIEHLLPPTRSTPDLTIHAWDSSGEPHWDPAKLEVHNLVSDRYSAVFEGDRLYAYDRATKQAFFWTPDIGKLNALERSTPFRPILHWWAHDQGFQLTHAAAVGFFDTGALIVGAGGAGKSTTALACLADGLDIVSDDYCLIGFGQDIEEAHNVYNTAKLDDRSLQNLPSMEYLVFDRDTGPKRKHILDLRCLYGAGVISYSMPLKVILVPEVASRGPTAVSPVSSAVALAALAPSTMFQLPNARAESFRKLAALVKQLPCYRLTLGRYPHEASEVIAPLLESLI